MKIGGGLEFDLFANLSFLPSACGVSVVPGGHSSSGSHIRRGLWSKQRPTFNSEKSWCILRKPCPVRCHMGNYSRFYIYLLALVPTMERWHIFLCSDFSSLLDSSAVVPGRGEEEGRSGRLCHSLPLLAFPHCVRHLPFPDPPTRGTEAGMSRDIRSSFVKALS